MHITDGVIDAYINEHENLYVEELMNYIKIPSVSLTRKVDRNIDSAINFITGKMKQSGLTVKIYETSGNPIVYGETGEEDAQFTLLIYGHYDVFPIEGQDGWNQTDPFKPILQNDRIWGRGSSDNKSQHLSQLNAISLIDSIMGSIPVKIKMIIEGEEETGSSALKEFISNNRELLKADLCFYSDGPMYPGDHPVLLLGVRGILCLELTAETSNKPLHSGNFGGIAPNPALALCQLISSMVDSKNNITIPGIDIDHSGSDKDDLKAIQNLPLNIKQIENDIGAKPITGESKEDYYTRLLLRPNLNVAGIDSGYTGNGIKTIIPNKATAKIDIRLVGNQDPDDIFEKIKDFIQKSDFNVVKVKKLIGQPPSKTDINHPYVEIIKQSVKKGFKKQPLVVPCLGGTTPDYVFTKILGIPSIVVPYAPYDQNNHAPNESTKVSLFLNGIRTTAQLIQSLANNY